MNILYKIYYGENLVYLGRTHQDLKRRLHGHFFKKPMHKLIDINHVTKIEYAELKTEADMFLYEIYYINKYKPCFNCDDKAKDELTASIDEIEFLPYECNLMKKWIFQINQRNTERDILTSKRVQYETICREARKTMKGDIYWDYIENARIELFG